MSEEEEVLRISAMRLVEEHGAAAEEYATQKMYQCMESEDVVQASVWLAISQAVHRIQVSKVLH